MNPQTAAVDRVNRLVLTVLGAALLALAVVGLVASAGGFGRRVADAPLYGRVPRGWFETNGWALWLVALFGVLVALLALRWLLAQVHSERVTRLDLERDLAEGRTLLGGGALTSAVVADVETLPGVRRAGASLLGTSRPWLRLTVDLDERADIAEVRRRLETGSVPRLRRVLGEEHFPVEALLRLPASTRATVL